MLQLAGTPKKSFVLCASNRTRGIPTIHGQVMAFDADTGETLFILDGPTVTGRRTAAMSMLGVHTFASATPREFLLIGTGLMGFAVFRRKMRQPR